MTDPVGSTAMAGRAGAEAGEDLRIEHFGAQRGALERAGSNRMGAR
jgi:hypothetical protein